MDKSFLSRLRPYIHANVNKTHSQHVVDRFPVQLLSLLCVVFYAALNQLKLKLLWLLYIKLLITYLSLFRFLRLLLPIFHFRSLLRLPGLPFSNLSPSLLSLSPNAALALARAIVLSLSLSLSLAAAILPPPSPMMMSFIIIIGEGGGTLSEHSGHKFHPHPPSLPDPEPQDPPTFAFHTKGTWWKRGKGDIVGVTDRRGRIVGREEGSQGSGRENSETPAGAAKCQGWQGRPRYMHI